MVMFSRQNIRGLAVIMAIIAAIILLLYIGKPRVKQYMAERTPSDSVNQSCTDNPTERPTPVKQRDSLFTFDPNTVTYEQLRLLGLDKRTAVGIIKYRTKGKVFSITEDFALCYGITDSIYARLKPYIRIAEGFQAKPESNARSHRFDDKPRFSPRPFEPFRIDTVGVEYLRLIGFSTRQARTLIEYRDRHADGILDMNELRDCYAVSAEMADSLAHFVIFPEPKPYGGKIEINSADSAALRSVHGIGAKSVVAIMQYRKLLGGFYSVEQIAELKCVTSENFALISKQICCDSCFISKIDINFASASELEYHPYMTRGAINKIEELRKSKGGWKSIEEMMNDKIFVKEQADAIAPYLHFGTTPLEFN